ncbi:MAG TPA: hypothetical protein VE172_08590 [Stackebrandtia sp.]|jgi:hypothetical protein|uniref:hypothetical protein n=1 Tax=Stackebrandtia sp. TaxID=2023065 RepID=UPI002D6E5D22|nr:hypothetical protein [Stackebrandtia sp.]HZE38858.1 hypothetical protein [Stackebrandtia sp.]
MTLATLGADLYQLHLAGKEDLPAAAGVYKDIDGDVTSVSVPDQGYWTEALTQTSRIIVDCDSNMWEAGNVLRLLAYDLAAHDSAAATELKHDADLTSLPKLGPDGWSDNTRSDDDLVRHAEGR